MEDLIEDKEKLGTYEQGFLAELASMLREYVNKGADHDQLSELMHELADNLDIDKDQEQLCNF